MGFFDVPPTVFAELLDLAGANAASISEPLNLPAMLPPEPAMLQPEPGLPPPEQTDMPPPQIDVPPEQADVPPEQADIPELFVPYEIFPFYYDEPPLLIDAPQPQIYESRPQIGALSPQIDVPQVPMDEPPAQTLDFYIECPATPLSGNRSVLLNLSITSNRGVHYQDVKRRVRRAMGFSDEVDFDLNIEHPGLSPIFQTIATVEPHIRLRVGLPARFLSDYHMGMINCKWLT